MDDNVAYILTNSALKLILNGKPFTATKDHPNYDSIVEALKDKESAEVLIELVDVEKAISAKLSTGNGRAEVRGGVVFFDGTAIHNSLTNRILDMLSEGFPIEPMLSFLENLMENPSKQSVDELYDFLDHTGLPITEDGHFLAYKGISDDFKDIFSGTIDNSPGKIVEVARNSVDDRRENSCSNGLHAGHFDYATSWAGSQGPVVLVKINPRDAVSVPKDANCGKLRTCRYEVLRVFTSVGELEGSLYTSGGDLYKDGDTGLEVEVDLSSYDDEVADLANWYDGAYSREEVVELAVNQGLFRIREDARAAGKESVCVKLAEADLGL
jgi:hypothetical protein